MSDKISVCVTRFGFADYRVQERTSWGDRVTVLADRFWTAAGAVRAAKKYCCPNPPPPPPRVVWRGERPKTEEDT